MCLEERPCPTLCFSFQNGGVHRLRKTVKTRQISCNCVSSVFNAIDVIITSELGQLSRDATQLLIIDGVALIQEPYYCYLNL